MKAMAAMLAIFSRLLGVLFLRPYLPSSDLSASGVRNKKFGVMSSIVNFYFAIFNLEMMG